MTCTSATHIVVRLTQPCYMVAAYIVVRLVKLCSTAAAYTIVCLAKSCHIMSSSTVQCCNNQSTTQLPTASQLWRDYGCRYGACEELGTLKSIRKVVAWELEQEEPGD
jgi:hypothetical protein